MNPSIILGVCAGMVLYVVLRTLVGSRKSSHTSDCAAQIVAGVAEDRKSSAVPSQHTADVTRVSAVKGESDAASPELGKKEEPGQTPRFPADRVPPKSSLSVAFSGAKRKQWFLVKSTSGAVKVCQAFERTPKTIAGPFATKEEAYRAKES